MPNRSSSLANRLVKRPSLWGNLAMAKFAVILPAAGQSSRFKDKEKKPFAQLEGRAVWLRSAELFVTRSDVCQCIIVVAKGDQEVFRRRYGANLALVKPEADLVAIHDAARPCLTEELVDAIFAKGEKTGAAILAVPITDTIK